MCPLRGCATALNFSLGDDAPINSIIGILNISMDDIGVPVTCSVQPAEMFGLAQATIIPSNSDFHRIVLLKPLNYADASLLSIFADCSVVDGNNVVATTNPIVSTINLLDKPKAPQPPILSVVALVPEVITAPMVVGTVYAFNPSSTATNITFSIVESNSPFHLSAPTCASNISGLFCFVVVSLNQNVTGVVFNRNSNGGFDATGLVPVVVRATDSGSLKQVDTSLNVPIAFVNHAPLSPTWIDLHQVEELSIAGSRVGTLQTNDVHVGLAQSMVIIGTQSPVRIVGNDVYLVRAVGSFVTNQIISFSVNVTNAPPAGQPAMSVVFILNFSVIHKPMTSIIRSRAPGSSIYADGSTLAVFEKSIENTAIGSLEVTNNDVNAVVIFEIIGDAEGKSYFTIVNRMIVHTNRSLVRTWISSVRIIVQTRVAGFPTTTASFTLDVQAVIILPSIVFMTTNGISVTEDANPSLQQDGVASFKILNAPNAVPTLVPPSLFMVQLIPLTDVWEIRLKVSPAAIGIRANASYGALTVFVVYNSEGASVFAVAPSVTITKAILNTNGNGNLNFGSNKSINNEEVSGASTPDAPNSIVGPIVGAIVGMIVLLGIIAYIAYLKKNNRVIAAKKKKNEMYQACSVCKRGLHMIQLTTFCLACKIHSTHGIAPTCRAPKPKNFSLTATFLKGHFLFATRLRHMVCFSLLNLDHSLRCCGRVLLYVTTPPIAFLKLCTHPRYFGIQGGTCSPSKRRPQLCMKKFACLILAHTTLSRQVRRINPSFQAFLRLLNGILCSAMVFASHLLSTIRCTTTTTCVPMQTMVMWHQTASRSTCKLEMR